MFTHVTVELEYGKFDAFAANMARVVDIVVAGGWELREALVNLNGRLFTVHHIWKMRDMNHYMEGVAALNAHPDFTEIFAAMDGMIQKETIAFALPTPYSPSAQG